LCQSADRISKRRRTREDRLAAKFRTLPLALVACLAATPAFAGKAEVWVEFVANNIDKAEIANSPNANATKSTVLRGNTKQAKVAIIDIKDDKSEQTIPAGSTFPLYVAIQGFISALACEVKTPTQDVVLVHNGGDAIVKTKVQLNASGCSVERTTCSGSACKVQG
jgi:hypothetical protein